MKEAGEDKQRNWLLAGGLGAAFVGSLCCTGPAAFIALGLGSFAAGAFFDSIRPWMGGLAVIALAAAWHRAFRKSHRCKGDCAVSEKRDRPHIVLLGVATLLSLGLLAYPAISENVLDARNAENIGTIDDSTILSLSIPSMDCASCAVGIQSKLSELEGIQSARIVYEAKLAQVVYNPKEITEARILQAIETTGFSPMRIHPNETHAQ